MKPIVENFFPYLKIVLIHRAIRGRDIVIDELQPL